MTDRYTEIFREYCVPDAIPPILPKELVEDAVLEAGLPFSDSAAADWFASVDITEDRFIQFCLSLENHLPSETTLRNAFALCDVDNVGYLDVEGFVAMMTNDGATTDSQALELMQQCDFDGDGRVSVDDLVGFVTHRCKPSTKSSTTSRLTELYGREEVERHLCNDQEHEERNQIGDSMTRTMPKHPSASATPESPLPTTTPVTPGVASSPPASVPQPAVVITTGSGTRENPPPKNKDGGCCIVA